MDTRHRPHPRLRRLAPRVPKRPARPSSRLNRSTPAVPSGRDGNDSASKPEWAACSNDAAWFTCQHANGLPRLARRRRTCASRPNRSRKAWARASPWAAPAAAFKLTVGSWKDFRDDPSCHVLEGVPFERPELPQPALRTGQLRLPYLLGPSPQHADQGSYCPRGE